MDSGRAAAGLAAALAVAMLIAGCGDAGQSETDRDGDAGRAARSGGPGGSGESGGARATLESGERVVFIGDSLAVTNPPTYADLLPSELRGGAPGVAVTNLSEPGSATADWLPGGQLFARLEPELARTDLVAITTGGNDLERALGGIDGIDSLTEAGSDVDSGRRFTAAARAFRRDLGRIIERIRRLAPGIGIVYVSYPDYSRATAWREAGGGLGALALRVGLGALLEGAREAEPDLVVDMLAATSDRDVDALLADTEHLGAAGHELYARELAAALSR